MNIVQHCLSHTLSLTLPQPTFLFSTITIPSNKRKRKSPILAPSHSSFIIRISTHTPTRNTLSYLFDRFHMLIVILFTPPSHCTHTKKTFTCAFAFSFIRTTHEYTLYYTYDFWKLHVQVDCVTRQNVLSNPSMIYAIVCNMLCIYRCVVYVYM